MPQFAKHFKTDGKSWHFAKGSETQFLLAPSNGKCSALPTAPMAVVDADPLLLRPGDTALVPTIWDRRNPEEDFQLEARGPKAVFGWCPGCHGPRHNCLRGGPYPGEQGSQSQSPEESQTRSLRRDLTGRPRVVVRIRPRPEGACVAPPGQLRGSVRQGQDIRHSHQP